MSDSDSSDNVANLTVEILKGIRADIQKTNAQLTDTNARIDRLTVQTAQGIAALERETIRGFAGVHQRLDDVTGRLDNLRDFSGDRWRDHETRIDRLEHHAGLGKPGG